VVHTFHVETRAVQLGDTNETFVEIIAGLREGERVALTDLASPADGVAPGEGGKDLSIRSDRGAHLGPR